MHILLIDDDTSLRKSIRLALGAMEHTVVEASDAVAALDVVARVQLDLALLDLRLARESGLDVLPELLRLAPGLHVVVVTAYATIETAVEAMRRGAFDYLPKPFTPDQLRLVLDRIARIRRHAIAWTRWKSRVRRLSLKPTLEHGGAGDACSLIWPKARRARLRSCCGRAHGQGRAVLPPFTPAPAAGPFVTVHCPSLSAELLESELFGMYRRFTGAVKDTVGKVAVAAGARCSSMKWDLPPPLQPKLLRSCKTALRARRRRANAPPMFASWRRRIATEAGLPRAPPRGLYRLNVIE